MTDIELLRVAKERLFEKGWQKAGLGHPSGPNCLVGAIRNATLFMDYTHPVYKALGENIPKGVWEGQDRFLYAIEFFNDLESTTFDDIIDLIDRTIKALEQEQ